MTRSDIWPAEAGAPTGPAPPQPRPDPPRRRLPRRAGRVLAWLLPPAGYLALALYVSWPFVWAPRSRLSPGGTGSDETLTQWFLAHTAYALSHLRDPFTTDHLNVPVGVNLAAQASMVGLGAPLAPVTLLFGAPVALAVLIVASPAATATAWYWLLWRKLRLHPLAAAPAALLCGFNPQLLLEATGRNHMAMQALLPVLIWCVVRLGQPDHPVRRGVLLGLLVTWQALIGEEALLLAALAGTVFGAAYVAQRPGTLRLAGRYARGLAIAAAVAVPLLAYPLWRQFLGPGHVTDFPGYEAYHATVGSYLGLPPQWAAWVGDAWWTVPSPALVGLPVLASLLLTAVALYRRPTVVACALVAVVFAVLSLGSRIDLGPARAVTGPWRWFAGVPVLQAALPSRMVLVVATAGAVVLGYGLDAGLRASWSALAGARHRPAALLRAVPPLAGLSTLVLLVGAAAIQLAPARYPTWRPAAVPAFVTAGHWRPYLAGGRSLVTVPVTSMFWGDGQRMATATGTEMAIAGGYFLAADPVTGAVAPTAPPTWTSTYLEQIVAAGAPPAPVPGDRARLLADLRRWRAGVLVLLAGQVHVAALRDGVARLLGPPRWDAGVWLWDVRALTAD